MPAKRKTPAASKKGAQEPNDQAREAEALYALSKKKSKRATARFENAVSAIARKHAMNTADRSKPHKFAILMKESEKLADRGSYAECLRSGLYDHCGVVHVQKSLDDLVDGIEDDDSYDRAAYHETCREVLETVFPDDDMCDKLSEWLSQMEPRPAGMSLDAYSDQFVTALDVVTWVHEVYDRPCSPTWHLTRAKLFLTKLSCKWLEVQFLPILNSGMTLDDLIRRIELVATVRDLDEDHTETKENAP